MERPKEVDVLDEISELLYQEHKAIQPFLEQVLLKVRKIISADIGFIGLVEEDERGRWLVLKDRDNSLIGAEAGRWPGYDRVKAGGEELPKPERSFTGYVAYTGLPGRSGDVKMEQFYRECHPRVKSELAVPIILDEEVLGVINLENEIPHFYTEEHEKILKIVARLIARPLYCLMTREGFRKPLLEALDRVRDTLDAVPPGTNFEDTDVLSDIAAIVARALDSKSCTIWLLNKARTKIELRGAYGPHQQYLDRNHYEGCEQTLAWRAINQRCLLRFGANYLRDELSSKYELEVYGRKLTAPFMIAPMLGRKEAIGVIKVGFKSRTKTDPYTERDEQLLNILQGQIATAVEIRRLEVERRDQATEQIKQLSTLSEIFNHLDLETVLEKAANKVPELCNGLSCSIFLWKEEKQAFVLAASKGLPENLIGEAYYLPGEGLTGWIAKHGKPLILERRCPSYLNRLHPELAWKGKYNEPSYSSNLERTPYIGVPIFSQGRPTGVIRVCDRKDGVFSESDLQKLTLVANHISITMSYSQRSRQVSDYLAQELHDGLQVFSDQVLRRTGLALDDLEEGNYGSGKKHMEIVERAAKFFVDEIETIMGLLKTHIVDRLGLEGALMHFLKELEPNGVRMNLQATGKGEIPWSVQRHLYRIAQAAIDNIYAHAQASHAEVRLDIKSGDVRLTIQDDGKGFNRDVVLRAEGKYGLKGILWRTRDVLKGQVKINSRPGKGTKIIVVVPRRLSYEENFIATQTC